MELKFDFAQSATRAAIVEQLKAALGDAAWEAAAAQAESARFDQDHYHHIGDVNEAIDALDVPARVKDDMHGVYAILAQAEATVHECEVEHTHFHEVGNASALRNALLICLAIAALDPEKAAKVRAALGGEAEVEEKQEEETAVPDDAQLSEKIALMDPEKAAKVRAALAASKGGE